MADISESQQLWSLRQLIMAALADAIPITESLINFADVSRRLRPNVVSSLLHIDAGGLVHPLAAQPSRGYSRRQP